MQLPNFNKRNKTNKLLIQQQSSPFENRLKQDRFNNRCVLGEKPQRYEALDDPYTSYYFSNSSVKNHLKGLKRAIREERNLSEKTRLRKLISLRIKDKYDQYISPKTNIYEKELQHLEMQDLGKVSLYSLNVSKSKGSIDPTHVLNRRKLSRNIKDIPNIQGEMQSLNTTSKNFLEQPDERSLKEGSTKKEKPPQPKEQPKPLIKENKLPILIKGETQQQNAITYNNTLKQHEISPQPEEKTPDPKPFRKQSDQKRLANRLAQQLHQKKHERWVIFLQEKKKMLSTSTKLPSSEEKKRFTVNNEQKND